jgi:DNA-binding IclR family transcriptional regulator
MLSQSHKKIGAFAMPNDLLGSVRRTLRILDYLGQTASGLTPREISAATKSNISTVYHVLNTLCADGYAKRDEASGRYSLGRKVVPLGQAFLRRIKPHKHMRDILHDLSAATGEGAYLTVLTGGDLVVAHIAGSSRLPHDTPPYLGYSENFHALAMGKAALAYCPPAFVREYFAAAPPTALTPSTLRSVDAVEAELERVRAQGFAESLEEFNEGSCAVGAPIFDGRGGVYGALSICLSSSRYHKTRTAARESVILAANKATTELAGLARPWKAACTAT